jgi:nucleoside-diphosphate-sugar epimerase
MSILNKQRIFITGASGGMGGATLQALLAEKERPEIVILSLDTERDREVLAPYEKTDGLSIRWGDLTNYSDVLECVRGADIVLHIGALVSPVADYKPKAAMTVNYGSTVNIIKAIKELGQGDSTKLVYIGTVAETGDRMPPIQWGRVGDPLKPSVFDYYAVSKIAAEREVIESGLKYWVSLRQTGILSKKMSEINDAIMFHGGLDNVLEYVSERDSATLMCKLCHGTPDGFWRHVYNIGGGESCRISTYELFSELFGRIGIKDLSNALDSKWFATRNFHGQYYLDSDKLENIFHFRSDSMEYYYGFYLKNLGATATLARIITKLPFGQRLIGGVMKKRFLALARTEHGTVRFIEEGMEDHVAAYFSSRKVWENIQSLAKMQHFKEWDKVMPIDHGYDEEKPESALTLEDVKGAAKFRGGSCESEAMEKGDWATKLKFRCAFGHEFEASPRLVLEGGHWCPVCERESWNYHNLAKVNPFFAQVWYPLHDKDETPRVYKKIVTELDV